MDIQAAILLALVTQLGSDSFPRREAASHALAKLGAASLVYLEVAEHSRDREVAALAKQLLDSWYSLNAERIADGVIGGRAPWLALIEDVVTDGQQVYLARARKQIGFQGPPHWKDYQLATRLLVVDMARDRVQYGEMARVVGELRAAERYWIKSHGKSFDPPILDLPK